MTKFLYLFITLCSLASLNGFAQQCEQETSLEWILNQAETNHPSILLGRLNFDKVQSGEATAKKIINPELEHFSVWGKEFSGENVYMNESRLWFTLQLAGKRNKRIEEWGKEVEMAKQEEISLRQSLLKDLWLNFFRIHQINEEIELKKVMIEHLDKILAQYNKRKFLSPDQSLEERIFTMVVDNMNLAMNQLYRERLSVLRFFREITGFQCAISKISVEANKIKWPKLENLKGLENKDSLPVKLLEKELELSLARVNLAEASGTPDLRLTPVIQSFGDKQAFNSAYGLAFVFPLAIFDRNQSERARAMTTHKYTERRVELEKKRENHYFYFMLEEYEQTSHVLKEVEVIDASVKKFKTISGSFSEGKISISNIVEFCRQLDEILERYHIGEANLMRTLMELYEQRGALEYKTLESLL